MTIKFCIRPGLIATLLIINIAQANTAAHQTLQRWLIGNVDNHPSVQAAVSAVDASAFQLIAANQALYNPELEVDAESAGNVNTTTLGISQSIDWGDTRGARTKMADSQKQAAQFALESRRRNIAAELLTALADYHSTATLKVLAERGNRLMQRSAELAAQRYEAGDLGQVEVDLARLSYAQARFKQADAATSHARAEQTLIALTGHANRNWPEFVDKLEAPQTDTQNIDAIIQTLPEMREITSKVAAAQARVKLRSGEGAASPTFAIRAGKEEKESVLGLTFSMPLQLRNNFKAEVDVANAEMIHAEREAMDAYRKLKSRLEIAIISYELSREAWLAWQASGADSLNQQFELLERLWKAGELSTTDYLVQLTQTLDTKASAIEQRGRMWTDWTEWLITSGNIEHWLNTGDKQ